MSPRLGVLSWGRRLLLGPVSVSQPSSLFPTDIFSFPHSYVQTAVVLAQNLVQEWPDHLSTEDTSHFGHKSLAAQSVDSARVANHFCRIRGEDLLVPSAACSGPDPAPGRSCGKVTWHDTSFTAKMSSSIPVPGGASPASSHTSKMPKRRDAFLFQANFVQVSFL